MPVYFVNRTLIWETSSFRLQWIHGAVSGHFEQEKKNVFGDWPGGRGSAQLQSAVAKGYMKDGGLSLPFYTPPIVLCTCYMI